MKLKVTKKTAGAGIAIPAPIIISIVALLVIVGAYVALFVLPDRRRKSLAAQTDPLASRPLWRDDRFPLSRWSRGERVKQLQRYLKVTDDGMWGPITEAAFQASAIPKVNGKSELTEENYYAFEINTK